MSDEEQVEVPQKSKAGLIIIVVVVVCVAAVAGMAVIAFGGSEAEAAENPEQKADDGKPAGMPGPLVKMDSFIVNIGAGETSRYLKASIAVELVGEETREAFDGAVMIMRNEILMYLSSLEVEKTRTVEQKQNIEKRLVELLNKRIQSEIVTGVYFTEFVTQ